MLYRPARMALHIGRVGALAVALGVGGGVWVSGFGAPVAQADSDLDNFGPSIGVSIGGHDIVQSGSASVSTQGRGVVGHRDRSPDVGHSRRDGQPGSCHRSA